jgi:hypothetical protein
LAQSDGLRRDAAAFADWAGFAVFVEKEKAFFFEKKKQKTFMSLGGRYLVASGVLLVAGCGIGPIHVPYESRENVNRVSGYPGVMKQPLAPMAGNAWPAPPTPPLTMLDFLKQSKTAGPSSLRPAGGAASRGDFGLCRRGGQGAALGVC